MSVMARVSPPIAVGTFSAKKVAQAVRWSDIEVTKTTIRHGCPTTATLHGAAPLGAAHSLGAGAGPDADSDLSGVDDDIPDEFEESAHALGVLAENISPLKPIRSLADEHQHNPNLVKQFQELSRSFKAWRPIRGDGNCYYRAVLFSWLERALASGALESLRSFDAMLTARRSGASAPGLRSSIRTCHGLLKAWMARRAQCGSDAEVRGLLSEVSCEFNRQRSDLAFVLCLRHLIAEHLRRHAHDAMSTSADAGGALTYEAWAVAAVHCRSIEDYCEQHVYVMGRDAADLVQHVCPRVLRTAVRICMVDRETAKCNFVDYGDGLPPTSGETVSSAAELAATSAGGLQPELFLLFQPGHYDVLLPADGGAGRLLDPEAAPLQGAAPLEGRGCGAAPTPGVRLAGELCGAFRAAMRCLEGKLAEELAAKQRRLGSLDESLFEGQLSSVLDPLRAALERFWRAAEGAPPPEACGAPLVPALEGFFRQAAAAGAAAAPGGPQGRSAASAAASRGPDLASPSFRGQGPADPGAAAPRAERGGARVPVAVEVRQREAPPAAPDAAHEPRGQECCICMQNGAATVAGCGCAYHAGCLLEYIQMEGRRPEDVTCHLHDKVLGADFLARHIPEIAHASPSAGASTPSATGRVTAGGSKVAFPTVEAPGPPVRQKLASASPQAPLPPVREAQACEPGAPWQVPRSAVIRAPAAGAPGAACAAGGPREAAPPGPPPSSSSVRRVPQSGNLGAALGVPCVICFGEEGVLKTLHCGFKAHVACLRSFWSEKVVTLCRLTDIRCPAEVAGCARTLEEADLRGIIGAEDLATAQRSIRDVDDRNRLLIDELKRQNEEYRPMFKCAICLVDHEVEGCCTLPCQHRFCFESLQYHFDIIVRERRLSKLTCPAEGCGHDLRSEESIHIFQQCLPETTYHKLLEFLTRADPHVYECRWPGCEERVFLDDGDDAADLACPRGHRFCGRCPSGPHPGLSCEERQRRLDEERREEEVQRDQDEAWRSAMALGWKPCPRRCTYGGGYKAAEECDHVTCECGFEFCWDCGVERQVALLHDNRWHRPSCRYHTRPSEVAEPPKWMPNCPECRRMRPGQPCPFPPDDGYPESYTRRPPAPAS